MCVRGYDARANGRDLSPNENGGPSDAPADRVLPHQTAISCYQILSSLRAHDQFAVLTAQTTRGGFFPGKKSAVPSDVYDFCSYVIKKYYTSSDSGPYAYINRGRRAYRPIAKGLNAIQRIGRKNILFFFTKNIAFRFT